MTQGSSDLIYHIRHHTTFQYSAPVRESVMQLRMRPRSDCGQRCLEFDLTTSPNARIHSYTDSVGNAVHHFDIPSVHQTLTIEAESLVERHAPPKQPAQLSMDAWAEVDRLAQRPENFDWVHPSNFAQPTQRLRALAEELRLSRRVDPLTTMMDLNTGLHRAMKFDPRSTRADSPIDECLEKRSGVCQDFAHVFIAIARLVGVPARYVSGHLFQQPDGESSAVREASHAWAEALLPDLGWVGFDATSGQCTGQGHIRTAIERDYFDAAPTRGVFKGVAETKLTVKVSVTQARQEGQP